METSAAQDTSAFELNSMNSGTNGDITEVDSEEQGLVTPNQSTQPPDRQGLVATFVLQLFCLLWLAPIVTLLTFNFMKWIVGASAWCLHRKCNPGILEPTISTPIKNVERFDKQDHNLLGALQIVAKVLEIWFTLIATALMSKLTFRLAWKKEGLPVGLLTGPSGFTDLLGTFKPLMPTSKTALLGTLRRVGKAIPSIFNQNQRASTNNYRWRIRALVSLTVLLCVVCNLMGPAVAVLVLPTLQWVSTTKVGDRTFDSMGADEPPQPAPYGEIDRYFSMFTLYCTDDDLTDWNLSCAADPYASKLDSWFGTYIAAGDFVDGITQEWSVKFRVNSTFSKLDPYTTTTWWTPSRQVLSSLDDDRTMAEMISQGYSDAQIDAQYGEAVERQTLDSPSTYLNYNNSLRLMLERQGPVLGAIVQMHQDPDGSATWTTKIDDKRSIRCFRDYDLLNAPFHEINDEAVSSGNFTKCVRVGSGWSESNKKVNFTIAGEYDNSTNTPGPAVRFSIYSSDKAQFFVGNKLPSWLPPECLKRGQVPPTAYCDWEKLFYTDPGTLLYNRTQDVVTIEMSMKQPGTKDTDNLVSRLTVDFVTFLGFTTYSLDPSPLYNPTALATTQTLPPTSALLHVDPTWMLAAWTVNISGTLQPDRTATTEVLRTMQRFSPFYLNDENDGYTDLNYHLSYISLLPVTQALSMIDFNTTAHASTSVAVAEGDLYPFQPHLWRNARIYVWTYGINGRTSKLGVAVAFIGIVIVLAQTVLGFVDRRRPPSLDQLLIAALEYVPRNDFHGIRDDEAKVAKTRFSLEEKTSCQGQYVFDRPRVGVLRAVRSGPGA